MPTTRTRTHRDAAMAIRQAWRAAGIPALVTADQARTIAAVHGLQLHPTTPHVSLAALAVEVTRPTRSAA